MVLSGAGHPEVLVLVYSTHDVAVFVVVVVVAAIAKKLEPVHVAPDVKISFDVVYSGDAHIHTGVISITGVVDDVFVSESLSGSHGVVVIHSRVAAG